MPHLLVNLREISLRRAKFVRRLMGENPGAFHKGMSTILDMYGDCRHLHLLVIHFASYYASFSVECQVDASGASRDHESLTSGESRSATKSEPPLLRLKALPSREALSRPYPPGPAACQNTKTPAAYTNAHENTTEFAPVSFQPFGSRRPTGHENACGVHEPTRKRGTVRRRNSLRRKKVEFSGDPRNQREGRPPWRPRPEPRASARRSRRPSAAPPIFV